MPLLKHRGAGRLLAIAAALTMALLLAMPAQAAGSSDSFVYSDMNKPRKEQGETRKKRKARQDMSWVRLHKRYPNAFVLNGPRSGRKVALTFDDAPDPRFTPQILDILADHRVCATFFVVGDRAARHPEIVRRMQREGHIIGNHSYDHAVLSTLSEAAFTNQVWRTDTVIRRLVGYSPRFIRPPYGELKPDQVQWGMRHGFIVVNWDVDSEDWKNNPGSAKIMANIRRTLQPGSIILQHAGGGKGQDLSGTIDALPRLIKRLQNQGYELVTLPELLGQRQYRPKP